MNKEIYNNPFIGCFLRCYSALVSDTEHFIIRTVRKFLGRLSDDRKSEVKKLFFQEGSHAREHKKINETLCDQGYPATTLSRFVYCCSYAWLELILPDRILLSSACALEHFNSELSTYFLHHDDLLTTQCHQLSSLLCWHFAEEIDHKSAVFNVCQEVNCGYLIRILGLMVGCTGFFFFIAMGTVYFAYKDRSLFTFSFWSSLIRFLLGRNGFVFYSIGSIFTYLRFGFHPVDRNNDHLVDKGLQLNRELEHGVNQ